jgi:hypothetical protein
MRRALPDCPRSRRFDALSAARSSNLAIYLVPAAKPRLFVDLRFLVDINVSPA